MSSETFPSKRPAEMRLYKDFRANEHFLTWRESAVAPGSISFKGAVQTQAAFQPLIAIQGQLNAPPAPLPAVVLFRRGCIGQASRATGILRQWLLTNQSMEGEASSPRRIGAWYLPPPIGRGQTQARPSPNSAKPTGIRSTRTSVGAWPTFMKRRTSPRHFLSDLSSSGHSRRPIR